MGQVPGSRSAALLELPPRALPSARGAWWHLLWSPTPLRYAGGACRQGKSVSQPPMAGISPYSICQQLPTKTGRNKARSSKSVTTFAVVYTGSSSWATLCIAELRVAPFDHCDKVCDFSVIFAPSTYACCRNLSEQFGRHEANTSNLRSAPKSTEIHFIHMKETTPGDHERYEMRGVIVFQVLNELTVSTGPA